MLVLEPLRGLRVVADAAALDVARWSGDGLIILRFAPDDALAVGARSVELDDEHAIVDVEAGYVGAWLPIADIAPHVEWALPGERPTLAQGSIAGVPAKLWLPDEGDALLLTAAAFADELAGRLR